MGARHGERESNSKEWIVGSSGESDGETEEEGMPAGEREGSNDTLMASPWGMQESKSGASGRTGPGEEGRRGTGEGGRNDDAWGGPRSTTYTGRGMTVRERKTMEEGRGHRGHNA